MEGKKPMKVDKLVGVASVFCLAMIAILFGRPSFSNASRPVRGITNPILAMEVVRNVNEVDAVLSDAPSADREVMRIKQYADFGFIAGYVTLYALMAALLAKEGRAMAMAAAILGIAAGTFDVIENFGILRIVDANLAHTTQSMIDWVRYPSLIKWAAASLALALIGVLAMRTRQIGLRIVGALYILGAILGSLGLWNNVLLQWLGIAMACGLVGTAILYFRPYWNIARRAA